MRHYLNFNTEWLFTDRDLIGNERLHLDDSSFTEVHLPHTNRLVPHHYFNESDYQFVSWYRRHFTTDSQWSGKRILLEFDGVMSVAEIYVNGSFAGDHKGGYTSFAIDITDYINPGAFNVLAVRVDSTCRKDIPPEGNLVDYLLFGGIYRDVRVVLAEPIHVKWAFIESKEITSYSAQIQPHYKIMNHFLDEVPCLVVTRLFDANENIAGMSSSILLLKGGENFVQHEQLNVVSPLLWTLEAPYLYKVQTDIYYESQLVDSYETRIGLRNAEFRQDGMFYLNGNPLKLRGLNRHQMFPYVGGAMPDRGQRKDADILKFELGLNFVRTSHYPPDPSFLERCDEIGLLVFEEMPGWQFIGDDAWKSVAKQHIKEMILRDRNHPSIFLWGVRINESADNHDFYLETNAIARSLDPSRPTGGVRCIRESEMLENVFTYNDFTFNRDGKIELPNHIPYMITEYMGHMYPTKSYDSIERQIKHALGHAAIQSGQYGVPSIAGAAGWCAFDYNTHQDFGSGDHVCYHGVSDMFRLPKFAAHFYRSQIEPEIEPVLFIARYVIPSFNEDYQDIVPVFSNCEEVDLYINGEKIATAMPDYLQFPSLPHPPFMFRGCNWWAWGGPMVSSMKAIGKINGVEVAEHELFPFGKPTFVRLKPDDFTIVADGGDMTRVVVELLDEKGQTLHLAHHPVFFEIEGPGKLIGENPFSLEAGRGAIYIQALRQAGTISLQAHVQGIGNTKIEIKTEQLAEPIVPHYQTQER